MGHETSIEETTNEHVKQQPVVQNSLHGKIYLKGYFPDEEAQGAEAGPSRSEPQANGHAVRYQEVNEEQERTEENNGNSVADDDGTGGRSDGNEQGVGDDPEDEGNTTGEDNNDDDSGATQSLLPPEGAPSNSAPS